MIWRAQDLHSFYAEDVADADKAAFATIPGVKVKARGESSIVVTAPQNAAGIIAGMFQSLDIPVTRTFPPPKPKRTASLALPLLRDGVTKMLTRYQRVGIGRAVQAGRLAYWWSTGSGKTLGEIIWGLSFSGRVLAVTKSSVTYQWAREVHIYTTCKAQVLEGELPHTMVAVNPESPYASSPEIDRDARFLVIGYDVLPAWVDRLKALGIRQVAFDEIADGAQNPKRWVCTVDTSNPDEEKKRFDPRDNIAYACMVLSRFCPNVIGATATPIGDRPRNVWAQQDIIQPGAWGNFRDFTARYADAHEGFNGSWDTSGASNLQELGRRCAQVVHRVTHAEVKAQLPQKRRLVSIVRTKDQVKPEGIAREIRAAMKVGGTALVEVRVLEAAARKRGVVLDAIGEAVRSDLKVCALTGRKRDCDQLMEQARRRWNRVPVFGGHGDLTAREREETKAGYMASEGPAIFIGTMQLWGTGHNLHTTDVAIAAQLPYRPRDIIQFEGRFQRLGRKEGVLIRYFVCERTIDEHIAQVLLSKLPALDQVVGNDEIDGLGRELIGMDDESLVRSLAAKILGEEAAA